MAHYNRHFAVSVILSVGLAAGQDWEKVLDSPFASTLRDCKARWIEISRQADPVVIADCYLKLLAAVRPHHARGEGIPQLKIPTLDPLTIPNPVKLGRSTEGLFSGLATGFTITGMSQAMTPKDAKMTYDPISKNLTIKVTMPGKLGISSRFAVNVGVANLVNPNHKGAAEGRSTSGLLTGYFDDAVASFIISLQSGKNGQLWVRSAVCDVDTGDIVLRFRTEGPEDPLGNLINGLANTPEMTRLLFNEIKPDVNEALASAVGLLLRGGWRVLEDM